MIINLKYDSSETLEVFHKSGLLSPRRSGILYDVSLSKQILGNIQ